MADKSFNYSKKRAELDELLMWFESDNVDIEQALEKFARAEKLINELEAYLNNTQAKIKLLVKTKKA